MSRISTLGLAACLFLIPALAGCRCLSEEECRVEADEFAVWLGDLWDFHSEAKAERWPGIDLPRVSRQLPACEDWPDVKVRYRLGIDGFDFESFDSDIPDRLAGDQPVLDLGQGAEDATYCRHLETGMRLLADGQVPWSKVVQAIGIILRGGFDEIEFALEQDGVRLPALPADSKYRRFLERIQHSIDEDTLALVSLLPVWFDLRSFRPEFRFCRGLYYDIRAIHGSVGTLFYGSKESFQTNLRQKLIDCSCRMPAHKFEAIVWYTFVLTHFKCVGLRRRVVAVGTPGCQIISAPADTPWWKVAPDVVGSRADAPICLDSVGAPPDRSDLIIQ